MKITVLENNVQNDSVLRSGIAKAVSLCQGIGFPLEVTYKTTNVVLTPNPLNTDVVQNGYGINFQPILDSVDGSEDVACMIYDATNINPKPTNPNQFGIKKLNCTPIQIPEFWYGGYDWVLTQFFLHELCHAIYFLVGQAQNDLTHNFYRSAYSQKQPTDYYLYLITTLKTAWNTYKSLPVAPQGLPQVVLTRNMTDTKETLGTLIVGNNAFGCRTLERIWLNNQPNISCIPTGTYLCQWKFKLNSLAYHYQVMNVPSRSGIFIHQGNYFFNSAGCIMLGSLPQDINKDGEPDLINSNLLLSAFEKMMGKKDFTLIIK